MSPEMSRVTRGFARYAHKTRGCREFVGTSETSYQQIKN
ncbi:hypothetical protein E24_00062 [Faustovirus]|nr:hypothetical protein E24_00062 [Faustovirus]AMN83982.1 hypothetical protein D5a_00062 [Faustovirus]